MLAQPFENWKEYEDPTPGIPCAWLRLSPDDGATWTEDVLVAAHPDNAIYYWDQRLATHPVDGRIVNMFWTHVPADGRDIDVHICWGTPDGRTWTVPVGTGLAGQHCQPISLGGDRLVAVYSHRESPGGIHASISEDFGRTWDPEAELVVWASDAGDEPGSSAPRAQEEYWNDMGAWQFGHPRGTLLPNGEVLVVFYGGSGSTRSGRWARIGMTDLLLRDAQVVDARGARADAWTCSCGTAGSRPSASRWMRPGLRSSPSAAAGSRPVS